MRFAVLLLVGTAAVLADSPSVQFSRRFNDLTQATPRAVRSDAAGNVYFCGMAGPGIFPLVHPLQSTGRMLLGKLDPTGNIVYSTLLGTPYGDVLTDCTVDSDGNSYLVGVTSSAVFPVTPDAIQRAIVGSSSAFVMKIDPTGQRILYSSYLGQDHNDYPLAIALDGRNAMYIAGVRQGYGPTHATVFVTKVVPDGSFIQYDAEPDYHGGMSAIKLAVTNLTEATLLINDEWNVSHVLKLNAAGDRLVYAVAMPAGTQIKAIASDAEGFIWAAGSSSLIGAATPDAAQTAPGGHVYFRSEDGGATWSAGNLEVGAVNQMIAVGGTLYAGTDEGLFVSSDNGRNWTKLLADVVRQIAADPSAMGTLYVLRSGATPMAKTTDGGATWQGLDPGVPGGQLLMALAIDPTHPSTLYTGARQIYRTNDGGATWSSSQPVPGNGVMGLAVDPSDPAVLYIAASPTYVGGGPAPSIPTTPSLMRTTDGGLTFQSGGQVNYVTRFAADPVHPGTAYAAGSQLYKTTDYGTHWSTLRSPATPGSFSFNALAIDASGALLVAAWDGRLYRSVDGGESFSPASKFQILGGSSFVIAGGAIHLAGRRGANAYFAKLDLAGKITYATYWGGRVTESATGVAVDRAGNVYVTGVGSSPDFPERNAVRDYSGGNDAFLVKLDPGGGVVYSTYWGGSGDEYPVGVATGPDGSAYFAGYTSSRDFPAELPGSLFVVGLR
jgi:photosystem II stability/assembly factor-like uncharacterized protein